VLAVPLAVIANLLTPRVRGWYGTTSYERTKKRLALLEKKLEKAKQEWLFTPAEWTTYHMVVLASMFVLLGFLIVFSTALLMELAAKKELLRLMSLSLYVQFLASAALGYLTVAGFFILSGRRASKTRQMHSEKGREEMEEEIIRLKALKESWGQKR
jgi:nitrate reductase gamma subunit